MQHKSAFHANHCRFSVPDETLSRDTKIPLRQTSDDKISNEIARSATIFDEIRRELKQK